MSDEIHMQAALRHAEAAAVLPWQGLSPDEALMAKEEPETDQLARWGWLYEAALAFLFADRAVERWENVGMRALALLRHVVPELLHGRPLDEVAELARAACVARHFPMGEFLELAECEEGRAVLCRILVYIYPPRRRWLYFGTQRAYLLARAYQPELVAIRKLVGPDGAKRVRRVELVYEDLAEIFEGEAARGALARDRARSRWSARAQAVLRRPIEAAGGTCRLTFGKSATAREAMARSARGNTNRKGRQA